MSHLQSRWLLKSHLPIAIEFRFGRHVEFIWINPFTGVRRTQSPERVLLPGRQVQNMSPESYQLELTRGA